MNAPCWRLQVRAKQEESDRQGAEVARLHATTPDALYRADLDAFDAALDERDAEDAREAELLVTQRGRAGRAGGAKVGTPCLREHASGRLDCEVRSWTQRLQSNITSLSE